LEKSLYCAAKPIIMLKKGYFNWLIYLCYAIVLLHNSTPHCHSQADESHEHKEVGEHHHEHHHAVTAFDWLNQLFDHHNETISGEEDVFEWLEGNNSVVSADICPDSPNDFLFTLPVLLSLTYTVQYYPRPEHLPKISETIFLRRPRHCNSSSLRAPPVFV
jgi:hypothetical protein